MSATLHTASILPQQQSLPPGRDRERERAREPTVVAGPPLDFSFKELRSCIEMESEEPRSGGKPRRPTDKDSAAGRDPADAAEASITVPDPKHVSTMQGASTSLMGTSAKLDGSQMRTPSPPAKVVIRKTTIAVKLNNNHIESVQDLPAALTCVMDHPLLNLKWIDLSFNRLTTIEPALLEFQQLKALYLHGNLIQHCSSMERLRGLPNLISLTSNGNPIESRHFYRNYILGCLPDLKSLDHSTITEDEKARASAFWSEHLRTKVRIQRQREEERMVSMEG